ncbi:MAG: winged helix-turn-helix domain-containing protein [Bacillota bacterium]
MRIKCRVWLEKDNEKIFGKGPFELLKRVEELGSLRQAAISMDMSYTKAHRMIANLERALGYEMLTKKIGGISGGSSALTDKCKSLMNKYILLEQSIRKAAEEIYTEIFEVKEQ